MARRAPSPTTLGLRLLHTQYRDDSTKRDRREGRVEERGRRREVKDWGEEMTEEERERGGEDRKEEESSGRRGIREEGRAGKERTKDDRTGEQD